MLGQVHRPDDGPARPELDDGDPAEVARPHPEPLERQVEQGQQDDLEDAVMADEDRPRMRRRGVVVAADLRRRERARAGRPPRAPRGCRRGRR